LLKQHNLKTIGLKTYREIFTFPVKKYYQQLGFDFSKTDFLDIGQKFIDLYNQKSGSLTLQPGAVYALKFFDQHNKSQYLISAREKNSLINDLKNFNLLHYFRKIYGLNNNFAHGKEDLFKLLLSEHSLSPDSTLVIGDTEHDCQLAKKFGFHIFLVANGHQSAYKLLSCSAYVFADLLRLIDFFQNA
jgi:phosphoglycolate phosphatase